MELNAQIITKDNEKEYAVLPYEEYLLVKEIIEDYEDLKDLRDAKAIDSEKQGKSIDELLLEIQ